MGAADKYTPGVNLKAYPEIKTNHSSEWQRADEIDPNRTLSAAYIEACIQHEEQITTTGFLKFAQKATRQPKGTPPLPDGTFRVLYADPPWAYDNSGFTFSAAQQYDTLPAEEIAELCDDDGRLVHELGAPDSVLFMWTTNPLVEDAFKVIRGWGYEYRTNIAWVKGPGQLVPGFYVNGRHELLMIATRGSCLPMCEPDGKPQSVIELPRTTHSRKPAEFYKLIETMYEGPYVELFARAKRDGWESWGNEVEAADQDPTQE